MKTKPILFSCAIVVILIGGMAFLKKSRKPPVSPTKAEVVSFLKAFNGAIEEAVVDNPVLEQTINYVPDFFEKTDNDVAMTHFVALLGGVRDPLGGRPITQLSVVVDQARLKNGDDGSVSVTVPVEMRYSVWDIKSTVLIVDLVKGPKGKLLIARADARQFLTDYLAYDKYAHDKKGVDSAGYSPVTLAALRSAKQLSGKYDSILWLDHVNRKTWYYVTSGTFDFGKMDSIGTTGYKPKAQMGLVGPDMKLIIPVQYDLVHNIGGTINGLVEVERGAKRGLYNLNGKIIVPVAYDQIFPLADGANLALLRKSNDYFYLEKDSSISAKIAGLKIADVMPKISGLNQSTTFADKAEGDVLEWNSYDDVDALIISPGYLSDLGLVRKMVFLQDPLRPKQQRGFGQGAIDVTIGFKGVKKDEHGWFASAFYSVIDHFIDGRAGFYDHTEFHAVLVADEKQNRLLSYQTTVDYRLPGDGVPPPNNPPYLRCGENRVRAINDSLFEYKTSVYTSQQLPGSKLEMENAPSYQYLHIRKGDLVAEHGEGVFACTHFVKMDDSYLEGCFFISGKNYDRAPPAVITFIKNEIYASHRYRFKDERWNKVFWGWFGRSDDNLKTSVDDLLTPIEKYNLKWLDSKLQAAKGDVLASR